jgi:hypothetical protein
LLTVQRSVRLGLHGDDPDGPGYLEFEVGVTGDDHELDITRLPHDNLVRPGEVDYFKHERLGAVVARVFEGDRQGDPSEGDRLLAQNHSIKWVRATLELVLGEPQSLEGVEVHEVKAATPIHEGLSEPSCSDQWVNNEGKPPWLRDAIQVVHSDKSDRRFGPAQVLQDHRAHDIDCSAGELELEAGLMRGRSTVNSHDHLLFGKRGGYCPY